MRTPAAVGTIADVPESAVVRVLMELSLEERPIRGWLEPEGGQRSEFVGLIDLVAALEALQLHRGAAVGAERVIEAEI